MILSAPDAVAQVLNKHTDSELLNNIGIDITESDSLNNTSQTSNGNGNGKNSVEITEAQQAMIGTQCPECPSNLIFEEGCLNCHQCGYSKCG